MATKELTKTNGLATKATLRNHLNLDTKKMTTLSKELNGLLSDYHVFYQNLRGFHWNVKGGDFFDLHEKFEELYDNVNEHIDVLAERIVTIGFNPLHTFEDFLKNSIHKSHRDVSTGDECLKHVINDLGILISTHRDLAGNAAAAEDIVTADMLTKFATELEKKLWMFTQFSK